MSFAVKGAVVVGNEQGVGAIDCPGTLVFTSDGTYCDGKPVPSSPDNAGPDQPSAAGSPEEAAPSSPDNAGPDQPSAAGSPEEAAPSSPDNAGPDQPSAAVSAGGALAAAVAAAVAMMGV